MNTANKTFEREKQTAIAAVRQASRLCRSIQSQALKGVLQKKDHTPVTIADFVSQALICRTLHDAFPRDPVMAEEGSAILREPGNENLLDQVVMFVRQIREEADAPSVCHWIDHGRADEFSHRFWTLDPVDGTRGFLRGEQFAISLALIVDAQVMVAVLALPNLSQFSHSDKPEGAIFVAVHEDGASVNYLDQDRPGWSIEVSHQKEARQAGFCESPDPGHSSHTDSAGIAVQLGITRPPLRLGSQIKYVLVAQGKEDMYFLLPSRIGGKEKIWDHAAGSLIVAEAGGKVTDITGNPLEFTHGRELAGNCGVIASNGYLHKEILKALKVAGIHSA